MADYYPLISRAVAGLDRNTGENRRALYERARGALVNQLRSVEPALEESEITRERLALEDSIRRVETEAAKRARAEADVEEPEAPPPPQSLRDRGLRDFRETVAEAESLGDAAAEASRVARERFDAVPGDEPPAPEAAEAPHPPAEPDRGAEEHYFEPPPEPEPEPVSEPPAAELSEAPPIGEPAPPAEALVQREEAPSRGWHPPPPTPGPDFDEDEDEAYARPARDYGRIIKIAVLLLLLAGIAGAGYWQRDNIMSMVASLRSPSPAPKPASQQAQQPAGQPKIADRIGPSSDGTPSSANAPAAAVAQKVVLYDEDPSDPQGKRYVGSAIWRTETVSPGPGMAPELAIRADIEIPERRMRMTWSLRRNTDKALPASHTIEIMFTLPADFAEGGIGNVPGVLMKTNEQARGVPLAGLAVKVTNGYFLIGLSSVEVDVQRNIQLLKERDWFDIPVVYTSGKRAILAMEKGTPGARAFEEAFRAWGQ